MRAGGTGVGLGWGRAAVQAGFRQEVTSEPSRKKSGGGRQRWTKEQGGEEARRP